MEPDASGFEIRKGRPAPPRSAGYPTDATESVVSGSQAEERARWHALDTRRFVVMRCLRHHSTVLRVVRKTSPNDDATCTLGQTEDATDTLVRRPRTLG